MSEESCRKRGPEVRRRAVRRCAFRSWMRGGRHAERIRPTVGQFQARCVPPNPTPHCSKVPVTPLLIQSPSCVRRVRPCLCSTLPPMRTLGPFASPRCDLMVVPWLGSCPESDQERLCPGSLTRVPRGDAMAMEPYVEVGQRKPMPCTLRARCDASSWRSAPFACAYQCRCDSRHMRPRIPIGQLACMHYQRSATTLLLAWRRRQRAKHPRTWARASLHAQAYT